MLIVLINLLEEKMARLTTKVKSSTMLDKRDKPTTKSLETLKTER
jgi:hypothetical protein